LACPQLAQVSDIGVEPHRDFRTEKGRCATLGFSVHGKPDAEVFTFVCLQGFSGVVVMLVTG
jgi:hypothetical protein